MSDTRPNFSYYYSNGFESTTRTGTSPGCTNQNGDGGFDSPTTGCGQQCPGCGADWCCDCTGCKPGKCDEDNGNTWCQDYYETWGKVAGGCPPPNNDPCYKIDPLTQRWVPNTDNCSCPGATRVAGHVCNPNTGDWDDPVVWGDPSTGDNDNDDPNDKGNDGNDPTQPTRTACYLKSVEVFGDFEWHEIPCKCRGLGASDMKKCIWPPKDQPLVCDCECGYYEITVGNETVSGWTCGEVCNGEYTGNECDIECHCHADCNPGELCSTSGQCTS